MSQPYVGEIRMGGWNFAPAGWQFCDGSLLPISQFETLFNLIGTTYGGDGQSTFAVPDLRGRLPIHFGTGPGLSSYVIAQSGGVETVTLNTQQIPAHSHVLEGSSTAATSTNPNGLAFSASSVEVYAAPSAVVQMSANTTSKGGSQPHDNIMPYLCVTFVISLFGVFPTQT